MRTALSQFSFALVVLKIFTSEFYPIGALFACYGAAILLVAVYRRYEGNRQFFDCEEPVVASSEESTFIGTGGDEVDGEGGNGIGNGHGSVSRGRRRSRMMLGTDAVVKKKFFRTSANSVGLLVGLSLMSYVALMVLLWELRE